MAETSIESKAEQTPTTLTLTQKVDEALGYDYEQLRTDALKLIEAAGGLMDRLGKVRGSDTDARMGALALAQRSLVDVDFHLRQGDHLAHLDESPSTQPMASS